MEDMKQAKNQVIKALEYVLPYCVIQGHVMVYFHFHGTYKEQLPEMLPLASPKILNEPFCVNAYMCLLQYRLLQVSLQRDR